MKLCKFSKRGLNLININPCEAIIRCNQEKRNYIRDYAKEKIEKANLKASLSSTVTSKMNLYTKAIMDIREVAKHLDDENIVIEIEIIIKRAIYNIKLNDLIEKAEKYEFKAS